MAMINSKVKPILSAILITLILVYSGIQIIDHTSRLVQSAEAASNWTQTTETDFSYGTFNNVKIVGSGTDAELRIDQDIGWVNLTLDTKPPARCAFAMAPVYGTDEVVLFGGNSASGYRKDTWVFNLEDRQWSKMPISTSPPKRYEHAMANVWGTDKILLHGGSGEIIGLYDDTWIYNASKNEWTEKFIVAPSKQGHVLSPIYGTHKVLLFGGKHGDVNRDSSYLYNLDNNSWTWLNSTNYPGYQAYSGMVPIYGTDKVVLFGGGRGAVPMDDLWVYDLSDNNWTQKNQTKKPSSRFAHSMVTIEGTDQVLVYGGCGNGNLNDSWIYDLSENKWTELELLKSPSPRYLHAMAAIHDTDKMLLFGGWDDDYLDETWLYQRYYSLSNGTYTSKPYDSGSNSSFTTFDWTSETPAATSIKFQLRTGINETDLTSKPFTGHEGEPSAFYTTSPSNIWLGHNGDRWVQYKVFFNTNNKEQQSALKDVTISYNCWPNTILVSPENNSYLNTNKPMFEWTITDDSSDQAAFQVLIDDDMDFGSIDYDSDMQNYAIQQWSFPVGTGYSKLPDGTWYWKVRTQDNEGSWGSYSSPFKFRIDTTPPVSEIVLYDNKEFYTYLDTISANAFDIESGTGVRKVEISIKRLSDDQFWTGFDWSGDETWLLTYMCKDYHPQWHYDTVSVSWSSGTQYELFSRATDWANNTEKPDKGIVITIDRDDPISVIESPKNNTWLNKLDKISGHGVDINGSGVDQVDLYIKDLKIDKYWVFRSWSSSQFWQDANVTETGEWFFNCSTIQWSSDPDTEYVICSRATDKAGNKEFPGVKSRFRFDLQPPTEQSIIINNADNYTNSTWVDLSLNAVDTLSGVHQMAFSTDKKTWPAWEEFNKGKLFNLSMGDGEKFVYFKASDLANNSAEPVFDSIILDTTSPVNLSISINDGASETNSTEVRLKLDAIDATSGLNQMSFSTDEKQWTTWENFSETKDFKLTQGDGLKTIYFRTMDRAGNVAESVSANITLNTKTPEINDTTDPDSKKVVDLSGHAMVWIVILILIIVILAVIFFMNKKKKQTIQYLPPSAAVMLHRDTAPKTVLEGQIISEPGQDIRPPEQPGAPQEQNHQK